MIRGPWNLGSGIAEAPGTADALTVPARRASRNEKEDSPVAHSTDDDHWMSAALREADKALRHGDVPVGAVVVKNGEIVGRGHNRREVDGDPLAHAEIVALRDAAQREGHWRLEGSTLYVTLEPCAMCAGALVNSRLETLVFGARDPKAGFCGSLADVVRDQRLNHRLEVREGVLAEECGDKLRRFFRQLRRERRRRRLQD